MIIIRHTHTSVDIKIVYEPWYGDWLNPSEVKLDSET